MLNIGLISTFSFEIIYIVQLEFESAVVRTLFLIIDVYKNFRYRIIYTFLPISVIFFSLLSFAIYFHYDDI